MAVAAGIALGWNIHRDLCLRPRVKVSFAIGRARAPRSGSESTGQSTGSLGSREMKSPARSPKTKRGNHFTKRAWKTCAARST